MSRHSRREEVDEAGEDVESYDSQGNDELIYDPDQDREEKRALRHDYRKLQDNELLLDPKAIKSESLTQMVQRADALFSKVKGPQEATLDSSFLVTAATLGNAKARSMRAGAGAFEIDDLVAAFFTFMGGHRPGEERLTDDGASVDQDIEGDRPLDWSRIGRKAMAKSRRVPAQDFMLGPLAVEVKKRNVAKRTQREKADAVERRPQELKEDDIEHSENETTKNVAALERFLEKQEAPMNLFRLIINPTSFGQSVENLFYLSFLIRDGKVALEYSEETDEPTIMLVEPPTDEDYKEGLAKKQMILELDVATWKKAIEVFDIKSSAMPTRKAAKTKLGDKWKASWTRNWHDASPAPPTRLVRSLSASPLDELALLFTMARRYDSRTTIFSPEGRLYQIEYAMEAISHAGTVLGVLSKDGVVLAAEKKVTGKLLDLSGSTTGGYGGSGEKIFLLNSNVVAGVAGYTADATSLVNYARTAAQRHLFSYDEDIPVEQLAQRLCDLKQGYTQYGGLRPFGASLLYAGWDPHYEFQLYHSDPSGNYSGWKATCIGANNGTAQSLLKQEYKDEITLEDAIGLVLKTLSKTMDSTTLGSEKLEFATLTLDPKTKTPRAKIYRPAEVDALLQKYELAKKEEDVEMGAS